MSTSLDQAGDSERLKAEGNKLFIKKDFTGAYQKYTEAIEHDSENAVLYCNRAACAFGLGRYLDSCTDATKATELDPSYAKAWGRLAQATASINNLNQAVRAWKRAIAVLPVENLTPAQKKQRDNYTAELAALQAKVADLDANPKPPKNFTATGTPENLPWNRAMALIPGLQATRQWNSSAWVITKAYREWQSGMEKVKMGRAVPAPLGRRGHFGHLGAVAELANTLIIDDRAFHITDKNWLDLYNRQLSVEITHARGWSDSGARKIMEQIPPKLKADGWDAVRPAISITVSGWIMRAFLEERLKGNVETALDFFTSALDLLQWGKELWKDVSFEDKGEVFQPAFIHGVKCLRLEALLTAYNKEPSRFPLTEILVGANELLAELDGVPEEPRDAEDIGAFLFSFRYPRGHAHALRGFYYNHAANSKAEKEAPSKELLAELMDELMESSTEYLEAANYYPIDDEKHAWYLHMAFNVLSDVGGPMDYLLTILNRLHDAIPRMKQIWEVTVDPDASVCEALAADMKHREEFLRMAEGRSEDELSCMIAKRW
ncbi:hypothetical protein LXA43DRAFT_1107045 [Ganoderma leucocontextum]|nr:hypothetical protein LXA43DRAFT_1107045 [Ganoderma leucocontextum]